MPQSPVSRSSCAATWAQGGRVADDLRVSSGSWRSNCTRASWVPAVGTHRLQFGVALQRDDGFVEALHADQRQGKGRTTRGRDLASGSIARRNASSACAGSPASSSMKARLNQSAALRRGWQLGQVARRQRASRSPIWAAGAAAGKRVCIASPALDHPGEPCERRLPAEHQGDDRAAQAGGRPGRSSALLQADLHAQVDLLEGDHRVRNDDGEEGHDRHLLVGDLAARRDLRTTSVKAATAIAATDRRHCRRGGAGEHEQRPLPEQRQRRDVEDHLRELEGR